MALRCAGETSLLGLEDSHAMTDLWSPRRPPLAPPPSPKLEAYNSKLGLTSLLPQQHTLTYLNQHLGDGVNTDDSRHSQIVCFHQPSRRYSWETECSSSSTSSCDENDAERTCTQRTRTPEDDDITLANTSSPARSSFSEANTFVLNSPDSSQLPSTGWKERYPKIDYISRRAWSATVPIRRSTASRPSIPQYTRPNTSRGPEDQYTNASRALASGQISPPTMRSTSIDPTLSRPPAHAIDLRAHSWPEFSQSFHPQSAYKPGRASPMPPGKQEKPFFEPDSSDEEKEAKEPKEQSLGRSCRRFKRRECQIRYGLGHADLDPTLSPFPSDGDTSGTSTDKTVS